jgi:hypothetical protein
MFDNYSKKGDMDKVCGLVKCIKNEDFKPLGV